MIPALAAVGLILVVIDSLVGARRRRERLRYRHNGRSSMPTPDVAEVVRGID